MKKISAIFIALLFASNAFAASGNVVVDTFHEIDKAIHAPKAEIQIYLDPAKIKFL